jgi:hypothetical protein
VRAWSPAGNWSFRGIDAGHWHSWGSDNRLGVGPRRRLNRTGWRPPSAAPGVAPCGWAERLGTIVMAASATHTMSRTTPRRTAGSAASAEVCPVPIFQLKVATKESIRIHTTIWIVLCTLTPG